MTSEIWWTPAADTVDLNDADRATINRLLACWRVRDPDALTLSPDELRVLNQVWIEICRGHPTRGNVGPEVLENSPVDLKLHYADLPTYAERKRLMNEARARNSDAAKPTDN